MPPNTERLVPVLDLGGGRAFRKFVGRQHASDTEPGETILSVSKMIRQMVP